MSDHEMAHIGILNEDGSYNRNVLDAIWQQFSTAPDTILMASDLLETGTFYDCKVSDILEQPVVICSLERIETRFGEAWLGIILHAGEPKRLLIGGEVLRKKMYQLEGYLPVRAKFVKVGRYFDVQ